MKIAGMAVVLLVVAVVVAGCGAAGDRAGSGGVAGAAGEPRAVGGSYEETLKFFRDLPYPRLEKLMDRNGGGATAAWRCESYYKRVRLDVGSIDESVYDTIIEFNTDVFLVPTVNNIRRRVQRADGVTVVRSARITALGHLISDEVSVNGVREGPARGWYLNGQLACCDVFKKGEVDGWSVAYSPEGQMLQKVQWRDGKCVAGWEFREGKWEQTVNDGDGWVMRYYWYFSDGKECGGDRYYDGVLDESDG